MAVVQYCQYRLHAATGACIPEHDQAAQPAHPCARTSHAGIRPPPPPVAPRADTTGGECAASASAQTPPRPTIATTAHMPRRCHLIRRKLCAGLCTLGFELQDGWLIADYSDFSNTRLDRSRLGWPMPMHACTPCHHGHGPPWRRMHLAGRLTWSGRAKPQSLRPARPQRAPEEAGSSLLQTLGHTPIPIPIPSCCSSSRRGTHKHKREEGRGWQGRQIECVRPKHAAHTTLHAH